MDQLKPVDNRRLYQRIADQIRGLIERGVFPTGGRLPPERELALQLGVSRPSVREALIALEIEGCVEVRMGAGIYVTSPAERKAAATVAMGESPIEIMQARSALEGSAIVLACARMTPEGLASLQENLVAMRQAIAEGRDPLAVDRQFHLMLAGMTGNSVMLRLITELFDERHSPIASRLTVRAENTQTWTAALREHEAIVAALESRDALAAQTAMRYHLAESQRRWLEPS